MRKAEITRNTTETQITLSLNLDGSGRYQGETGVGFMDHMLCLFAAHGMFDLTVGCTGDIQVDAHHTVEDLGIVLGQALAQAVGDKAGIRRYGSFLLPMDEALALVALDLSGRSHLTLETDIAAAAVGGFDTDLLEEFLLGFARAAGVTLHVRQLAGKNAHHIIEAIFKGLARALCEAVAEDPRRTGQIPSTKGVL